MQFERYFLVAELLKTYKGSLNFKKVLIGFVKTTAMSVFETYSSLIESALIDKFIGQKLGQQTFSLVVLVLISGPIASIFPLLSLYLRTILPDPLARKGLTWLTLVWCCYYGAWSWFSLLFGIEFIRSFFQYGVPYLMKKASTRISADPVAETFLRRLFRLIKHITQQNIAVSIQQLALASIGASQNDDTESFTDDERLKINKFFVDFPQSCFVIDLVEPNRAITIFFPSFIVRFAHNGFQLTSDESIQLIRNLQKDEECSICRDKFDSLAIELQCHHQFCMKCIFNWLNQQYTCPMCRANVN